LGDLVGIEVGSVDREVSNRFVEDRLGPVRSVGVSNRKRDEEVGGCDAVEDVRVEDRDEPTPGGVAAYRSMPVSSASC
jgi:hypothetical protein